MLLGSCIKTRFLIVSVSVCGSWLCYVCFLCEIVLSVCQTNVFLKKIPRHCIYIYFALYCYQGKKKYKKKKIPDLILNLRKLGLACPSAKLCCRWGLWEGSTTPFIYSNKLNDPSLVILCEFVNKINFQQKVEKLTRFDLFLLPFLISHPFSSRTSMLSNTSYLDLCYILSCTCYLFVCLFVFFVVFLLL